MLSLQSLGEENIRNAKSNFIKHVYSRLLIKIGVDKKKNIELLTKKLSITAQEADELFYLNKGKKITHPFNETEYKSLVNLLFEIISSVKLDLINRRFYQIFDKNVINEGKKLFLEHQNNETTLERKKVIKSQLAYQKYKFINDLFNYTDLSKGYNVSNIVHYNLYQLVEDLGIRTCPYCNKNYIFTIRDKDSKSEKLVNATIDHWLSQSQYPWLKVSFYNLIPSCSNCNSSIKSNDTFSIGTHVHPYLLKPDITSNYSFNFFRNADNTPTVYFDYHDLNKKDKKKIKETFNSFKLEILYNAHSLELKDLIELREEYGEDYLNSLKKAFPYMSISKERAYNILFNTTNKDDAHHLRPLSKFRFDILRKLDVID